MTTMFSDFYHFSAIKKMSVAGNQGDSIYTYRVIHLLVLMNLRYEYKYKLNYIMRLRRTVQIEHATDHGRTDMTIIRQIKAI
jgi:hypothetical protein